MASNEKASSEPPQSKACVLKVSIHCGGCARKVRKIIQNISGVNEILIEAQQNKVTVTGIVEAETIIRKLQKSGKHAEIWPVEKKPNPSPNCSSNCNDAKAKNKEKENDASKSIVKNSETDVKPTKIDTGTTASESKKDATKIDLKSETEMKPPDNATKSGTNSKRKGKKVVDEAKSNEEFVMSSGNDNVQPVHQVPMYSQPVYAASYNMVYPMARYSYYAPQSDMYSNNQQAEYYPQYYSHENYYGTSSENQGDYDYFSDENASGCIVM